MSLSENQATLLLGRMNAGDGEAARALLPLLYDELRAAVGDICVRGFDC